MLCLQTSGVENPDVTQQNSPRIIEIDNAIIISDVHLGYKKSNTSAFTRFLREMVDNGTSSNYAIFVIGDLWDYWRDHDVIVSPESDAVLSLLNKFKEVYYAPGNHDHVVMHAKEDYPDFSCYHISRYFRVKSGNTSFFLLHGHELEVISKLTYLTVDEYEKISDQLCRMNDEEGKIASYLHEIFHKLVPGRQVEINDLVQPAEERQGMDIIDKFAKSKAKYPLLGMQLSDILVFGHTHRPFFDLENNVINTGGWISDMMTPAWFKTKYGDDKVCSGWYVKIEMGNCELLPYDIHIIANRNDGQHSGSEPLTDRKNGEEKNTMESLKEQITKQTSNLVSDLIGKEPKN